MENLNHTTEATAEFKALFITLLKGIYNTEQAILDSLPTFINAATTHQLKDAFQDHEIVTRKQIMRLERIFRHLHITPKKEACSMMETFDKIVQKIIKVTPDKSMIRDAGLIVVGQQIEHYEIATYGGLIQFALAIDEHELADLLEQTLVEEEETDCELTYIGECHLNLEASGHSNNKPMDQQDNEEDEEDQQEDEDEDQAHGDSKNKASSTASKTSKGMNTSTSKDTKSKK